ncbi:MAG: hypothetical protein JNK65_07705 [Deltaproteobacteria bacterium]|nr:hypothetical protein [Deltaproteobacteria bacterium]
MSRLYGTFVTGGILPELYFIRKIEDPIKNKVVLENKPMDPSRFIITWDEKKKAESAPAETPSKDSKTGQNTVGAAAIPDTQPESQAETQTAESQNSETKPLTIAESKPKNDKLKKDKVPWDEMTYNSPLETAGEEWIKKDQLSISDYEKKILYGDYIPAGYAISPRTAATMVSMLQDIVKYGTGTRALALGKPAAGKTGTTNGATDAWFVGFTPTLLTGVWVGNDEKVKTIGHGATGGHVAAPIWVYYMQEATKKYPTKDFKVPSWIDLSKYQQPMELVKGDSEASDFAGSIPGAGGTGSSGGSHSGGGGAEFFSKDL